MDNFNLQELLENALHFGHKKEKWNPKMKDYIYGVQEGVHVFDLTKTAAKLTEALNFIAKCAMEGKTPLFVGTKLQAQPLVEETAKTLNAYYVKSKWLPGLLTNFTTIKSRIGYYKDLLEKEKNRELEKYTKKEISAFKKEIAMLQEMFEGVKEMDRLPDFVFIVDVHKEKIALREAVRLKIPVVAIVDSNGDPSFVNYIIPANDDAVKSVKYILNQVQTAFLKGRVGLAKLEPRVEKRVPKPDTAVKKTVKKTAVKSA